MRRQITGEVRWGSRFGSFWGLCLIALVCLVAGAVQATDKGPRHHARGEYDTVTVTYVVVEGDDLVAISERFEIPVEDLKAQNQLSSNEIKPGQKLVVATTGAAGSPTAKSYKMTTPIPASIPIPDRLETRFGTLNFFDRQELEHAFASLRPAGALVQQDLASG